MAEGVGNGTTVREMVIKVTKLLTLTEQQLRGRSSGKGHAAAGQGSRPCSLAHMPFQRKPKLQSQWDVLTSWEEYAIGYLMCLPKVNNPVCLKPGHTAIHLVERPQDEVKCFSKSYIESSYRIRAWWNFFQERSGQTWCSQWSLLWISVLHT